MVFLTAEWRNIAVLTYAVDTSVLERHLPKGLRLDLWKGQALVSLVGFQFLDTRVLDLRVPFWASFPEVNLRFYVCRETAEGERRGVVFIKEIVPYYAVAATARGLYNENYFHLPMSCEVTEGPRAEYRWQFGGRENRLAVTAGGLPRIPDDESLDAFIVEHYWGYSRSRSGEAIEYEVGRKPWRTYPIANFEMDVDVAGMYGPEMAEAMRGTPLSVVLAEGSKISVSVGRRVDLG